jgi:hypothetical protein
MKKHTHVSDEFIFYDVAWQLLVMCTTEFDYGQKFQVETLVKTV